MKMLHLNSCQKDLKIYFSKIISIPMAAIKKKGKKKKKKKNTGELTLLERDKSDLLRIQHDLLQSVVHEVFYHSWLVGCFGLNGLLRQ